MKDNIKDIIIKYIEGAPIDEIINMIYPWKLQIIIQKYNKENEKEK